MTTISDRSTTAPRTAPASAPTPRPEAPASRPAAVIPAAGPAWFGAVMGTGILATLLQRADLGGLTTVGAPLLLAVGWALLCGLGVGYLLRLRRGSTSLAESVAAVADATAWGLVAMGVLSVGGATLTVLPVIAPGADGLAVVLAVVLASMLWVAGSLLGVVTTLAFVRRMRREPAAPTFTWGLPVVPPMVTATTGAALAAVLPETAAAVVLGVSAVCFVLSLVVGGRVFVAAYLRHRHEPLPLAASTSAWIPLGVVGQSTAAAQGLAAEIGRSLAPEAAASLHDLAVGYGVAMLALGVPLVAWAVLRTGLGLVRRMPFTPGWWSLTFPLGTLALGAGMLGAATGSELVSGAGVALTLALVGTWTFCATATLRALARRP